MTQRDRAQAISEEAGLGKKCKFLVGLVCLACNYTPHVMVIPATFSSAKKNVDNLKYSTVRRTRKGNVLSAFFLMDVRCWI